MRNNPKRRAQAEPIRINTDPNTGLSDAEVARQRARGLVNTPPKSITKSAARIWREHIFTFFNAINIGIFLALLLVRSYTNMTFMIVVLANLLIGVLQEIRSKRMVERLSLLHSQTAVAIRRGERVELSRDELVLDDVIVLSLGCQVPTDSIVIDGTAEADESLLTGESTALIKKQGDYLLSGSVIVSGECRAKVERVGAKNYATTLAIEAGKPIRVVSKLMRSLRVIIDIAGGFVVPLGLLLFARAYLRLFATLESAVEQSAASMIGMIPSGLMLLTSTTLAVGVMRLSSKHMLVQEPHSIETLARADMLCLDKTGTLTSGNMSVKSLEPLCNDNSESLEQLLSDLLNAIPADNATSRALHAHFAKEGAKRANRITPFSSQRRYSAAAFDGYCLYAGAPGAVCPNNTDDVVSAAIEDGLAQGCRVVMLARGKASGDEPPAPADIETEPLALILLEDEIRESAKAVLDFFISEGVTIKLISGDDPRTVSHIAKRLGLEGAQSYVDICTVEGEEAVMAAAKEYAVFGRVSPHDKRLILRALQREGHTVAMTGDGVNDLLALREADCSIALHGGSSAARQAAHMVMLTDDFSALPDVVMEGRRVINNITRMAALFLVKTTYSLLLTLSAVLFAISYPLLPIQLSFISAITVGIPSFFLAMGRNNERISGSFLKDVLSRAIPAGLCVYIYAIISGIIGARLGLGYNEINTLCVYITGTVMLIILLRVSRPMVRWRAILWSAMAALFFTATVLLRSLLELAPNADAVMWIMYCAMAAGAYPLLSALSRLSNMIVEKSKAVLLRGR